MVIVYFAIFGLIIGSFLNVVIYRFASDEGGIIDGRSHCRSCSYQLTWKDNIPLLSYVFLKGKCRSCRDNISLQYPIVELSNASLWFVVACAIKPTLENPMMLVVAMLTALCFSALLTVFVYDLKHMEVPMVCIWITVAIALIIIAVQVIIGDLYFNHVIPIAIGAAMSFGFFFSLSYFSDEKWMGYGDGYIALAMALIMGPFGVFISILFGTWIGAIIGIGLQVFAGKTMKTAIPFGPFLIGGMYLAFILINFYPGTINFLRL